MTIVRIALATSGAVRQRTYDPRTKQVVYRTTDLCDRAR